MKNGVRLMDMKMKQLSHNGVLVAEYEPKSFHIKFKGKDVALSPVQEEMAVAWVKKLGTEYTEDPAFIGNFFEDFGKALNIKGRVVRGDFDFSEIEKDVNAERERKLAMSKDEKKALAAERKRLREANKEKYGYVVVDGERVEVSNYVVEPSSIFMGRGKHPLRGRWKQGAKKSDITLNISPGSKVPEGKWAAVIWEPEFMWVARWDDKLSGKKKYVWLSESSHIRQKKEIDKFDKALELQKKYPEIRRHIESSLSSPDPKRRKVATVCYLIDVLKIRVGDEKDEDEADTVGATTLTKDNIRLKPGNVVEFDFYGKDFVRLQKEVELPEQVVKNLEGLMADAKGGSSDSPIFNGVRSENVSAFLDEVAPGMSAKVFRTMHSTKAVSEQLEKSGAGKESSGAQKVHAARMANLQAAIVCNHKRKIPASWAASLERKKERLKAHEAKAKESLKKLEQKLREAEQKYTEKLSSYEQKQNKKDKDKKAIKNLKAKHRQQTARLKERIEKRKQADRVRMEKLRLQIKEQEATRDYNLGTSLKSYIDPRVYKRWCERVGMDWKSYYPKTLQKKFSWVEK